MVSASPPPPLLMALPLKIIFMVAYGRWNFGTLEKELFFAASLREVAKKKNLNGLTYPPSSLMAVFKMKKVIFY